jgi:hypothetical protein
MILGLTTTYVLRVYTIEAYITLISTVLAQNTETLSSTRSLHSLQICLRYLQAVLLYQAVQLVPSVLVILLDPMVPKIYIFQF